MALRFPGGEQQKPIVWTGVRYVSFRVNEVSGESLGNCRFVLGKRERPLAVVNCAGHLAQVAGERTDSVGFLGWEWCELEEEMWS